jgi:hypothetical protein
MFLVNNPSTKAEGECHSSIFYGLFENEKMNERQRIKEEANKSV